MIAKLTPDHICGVIRKAVEGFVLDIIFFENLEKLSCYVWPGV